MPRYMFSVTHAGDDVCETGFVKSPSLAEAVRAINDHVEVEQGDRLEIGVTGFPPARFECSWKQIGADPFWVSSTGIPMAPGRLAA